MAPAYCIIRLQSLGHTPLKPAVAITITCTNKPTVKQDDDEISNYSHSRSFSPPWDPHQFVTIQLQINDQALDAGLELHDICWSGDIARITQAEMAEKELDMERDGVYQGLWMGTKGLRQAYIPDASGAYHVWWEILELDLGIELPLH